ncbi:MAG: SagB/ThcOx family dehydrogenase [Candidatus Krumholzibacteria bacterium]|nr:SagB/ThcOx family dehydrogenase [Candidatus Krumholzibacteria bacterium]
MGPVSRHPACRSIIAAAVLLCCAAAGAQEPMRIVLPAPDMEGGLPLMKALALRSSSRSFAPEELPAQILSDLLWAAAGINRPESGKRTSPTARNMQQIDVYVGMAGGLYLYDPKEHALLPVMAGDIRAATGRQDFTAVAPVNLVYVADYARMGDGAEETKRFYAATDTGFIGQNVYLYCASAGLATVVRGAVDREALAKAMGLRPDQHVVLAQTVGYPGE